MKFNKIKVVHLLVLGLVCTVIAGVAFGEVTWQSDIIIGTGIASDADPAQAKLNIVAPGQVDIAWQKNGVQYSYWDVSSGVSTGQVLAANTCGIAGIGRYAADGSVRIGYTDTSWNVNEASNASGSWASQGIGAISLWEPGLADYEVNPNTGKGEFAVHKNTATDLDITHHYRDGSDNWTSGSAFAGTVTAWTNPNITHDSSGTAYFVAASGNASNSLSGGTAGGMVGVGLSNSLYKHAAIDEYNGTLYALVADTTRTYLYTKPASSGSWAQNSRVVDGGSTTQALDDFGMELAIGPNGEIATLFYDDEGGTYHNLFLALKDNLADTTWDITQLTSLTTLSARQYPDVKFDSNGDLYVAYFDETADELRLVTTVPEPATSIIILSGCLMMRRKRSNRK